MLTFDDKDAQTDIYDSILWLNH